MSRQKLKKNPAGKKKNKALYNVLIVIFSVIFLVSLGVLAYQLYAYYSAGKMVEMAEDLLNTQPTGEDLDNLPDGALDQFAALYARYPDFRGWITVDNTKVNYPVVQSKDNDYYLRRDMDGKYHRLGTVFADYRCRIEAEGLSDNTILYGHNAFDGSYFKDLVGYKKIDFYREHPFIQFDTIYEQSDWAVIGAFLVGIYPSQGEMFEYYNFVQAQDEETFDAYLAEVARRSYIHTDVPVEYGDKLLTLSTCDYEFDDARFVIVARRLREGETRESMDITASEHTGRFMPDAWYEAKGKSNPN